MADRAFQHDLTTDFFGRLSGASDAWDDGAAGAILTGEAFEAQASGGDFTLSVTEGADTASVVVGGSVVLAATEQPDTVTAQVGAGANLTLSVTESSDTVTASVEVGSVGFALSTTETADTVSIVMGASVALVATEQADTLSALVASGQSLSLAASEATDSASFTLDATPAFDLDLAASEASDTVAFEMSGERRQGGISRKRVPVVDVIWPDDPRHPNYIAPLAPLAGPTPERIAPNVIRVPQVAARQAAEPVQITQERPRYDAEIAILLLAA